MNSSKVSAQIYFNYGIDLIILVEGVQNQLEAAHKKMQDFANSIKRDTELLKNNYSSQVAENQKLKNTVKSCVQQKVSVLQKDQYKA